jgi:large subunit ribosomal protein L16
MVQKGVARKVGVADAELHFGEWGLRSRETGRVSARQLEAARRALRRRLARRGRVWRHPFPDTPVTSKPTEVRRGKGKGAVAFWAAKVRAGSLRFEIGGGVEEVRARSALDAAGAKLPVRTQATRRRLPRV